MERARQKRALEEDNGREHFFWQMDFPVLTSAVSGTLSAWQNTECFRLLLNSINLYHNKSYGSRSVSDYHQGLIWAAAVSKPSRGGMFPCDCEPSSGFFFLQGYRTKSLSFPVAIGWRLP